VHHSPLATCFYKSIETLSFTTVPIDAPTPSNLNLRFKRVYIIRTSTPRAKPGSLHGHALHPADTRIPLQGHILVFISLSLLLTSLLYFLWPSSSTPAKTPKYIENALQFEHLVVEFNSTKVKQINVIQSDRET
jgi:hypothetical protein